MRILFKVMILVLVLLLISCVREMVMPAADFAVNFCNFPQAWTKSKGSGVSVGIIDSTKGQYFDWLSKIQNLAPQSQIIV